MEQTDLGQKIFINQFFFILFFSSFDWSLQKNKTVVGRNLKRKKKNYFKSPRRWSCFCYLSLSGLLFSDIPEDEARYWAKKLEQLNAMRDQDVSCHCVWFNTHITYSHILRTRLITISYIIWWNPAVCRYFKYSLLISCYFVSPQYSCQEEQERPLRVPGTQCCKWPITVCTN